VKVQRPGPPVDAQCRGGSGEIRLGNDFVWRAALCRSLRKVLLSALAERKIGSKIGQFGSCTFTPKTGKTSMEVVELVPCAHNKWGNWWDFWFYVAEGTVEDHLGLPVAEMCSHYYSAYPQFEVAEEDADEGALRCAAGLSSGRDLVEEFVAYGCGPWRVAGRWAKYALARCLLVAGCWCGVPPSHWTCMAEIPPHSCVRRRMGRRGLLVATCQRRRASVVGTYADPMIV
jgi:hypothetical protein